MLFYTQKWAATSTRRSKLLVSSPAYCSTHTKGGFIRAKLLLRFLGELLNCGLVEAQEYGDMLTTLCAGYVTTELRQVQQPCRDMIAHMVLAAVLRVGPTLSKARKAQQAFGTWFTLSSDALTPSCHAGNTPRLYLLTFRSHRFVVTYRRGLEDSATLWTNFALSRLVVRHHSVSKG